MTAIELSFILQYHLEVKLFTVYSRQVWGLPGLLCQLCTQLSWSVRNAAHPKQQMAAKTTVEDAGEATANVQKLS